MKMMNGLVVSQEILLMHHQKLQELEKILTINIKRNIQKRIKNTENLHNVKIKSVNAKPSKKVLKIRGS
jgi:hypothetical protein